MLFPAAFATALPGEGKRYPARCGMCYSRHRSTYEIGSIEVSRDSGKSQEALRRTVSTLALIIGSALPAIIAFVLVASTNDSENPLDRVPNYDDPLIETLTLPLDSPEPVRTAYRYYGRVRLVFEGSGILPDGQSVDAFYRYEVGDASSAPVLTALLMVDGSPALEALGLSSEPPEYASDHLYSAVYDLRDAYRRLQFSVGGGPGSQGAFSVTVVQIR